MIGTGESNFAFQKEAILSMRDNENMLQEVILFLIGPKNTFNDFHYLKNYRIRKKTVAKKEIYFCISVGYKELTIEICNQRVGGSNPSVSSRFSRTHCHFS